MTTMTITGEVFRWARMRAGVSDEKLAKSVNAKPEKIRAWEAGKEYPNFQQAQKLASALSIPLGYLFLSEPPEMAIPIADFRTLPGREAVEISVDLQSVLDDALRKRDWYAEWRKLEGYEPFEFVGKFSRQRTIIEIVEDMRQVLEIPPGFASKIRTWDIHLREFVQKAERAGILILQSGIVGSNTHRKLSLEEFRGFVLADNNYAPLVFINAQDSTAARIFTLAHELAHIWTGTSGISNPHFQLEQKDTGKIEKLCNQVAAEFLVPSDLFAKVWNSYSSTVDNAQQLARYFRVSAQVIVRCAFDSGYIPFDEYQYAFQEVLKASKKPTKGSGGDFYATLFTRNSRRFTTELLGAVNSGHVSYLNGARLLNTKPKNLVKAMEKMK